MTARQPIPRMILGPRKAAFLGNPCATAYWFKSQWDNESTPIYDSFEAVASDRSGHIDHAQSLAALKLTQYFRGLKRSAAAGLFTDPICINNFLC
jgi:hypothetical protein